MGPVSEGTGMLAELACLWEVTARKVGNVHCQRNFVDLHFTDFLASAAAIREPFDRARQESVGATVLDAIRATRQVVATNTNLGMVLLLAPLAAVPGNEDLKGGVEKVLANLTLDDSRQVFAAIRLAVPGGLGQSPREDVQAEPTLPLREIMALAADRDLVARQYANGFRDVFDEGVPALLRHLDSGLGLEEAIILTHVDFLAHHPDSLIVRKRGLEEAMEAGRLANRVLTAGHDELPTALAALDAWLCAGGRNPGTSADLVTACLFVLLRERIMKLPLEHPWSTGWHHA